MKLLYKYRFIIISLIVALLFMYPYLVGPLNIEHDTLFHLSRIEGLAKAFSNNDFIPSIYFDKNMTYGYGSPLFYSDFFLVPFSLLYMLGVPLVVTYKLVLFVYTFIGCLLITQLLKRFKLNDQTKILALVLFTFALYRLTNVYVRGALGEVISYSFIPLVLLGIYEVLFNKKYLKLALGFSALLLSHNITFLLVAFVFLILIIMNYKLVIKDKLYYPIIKGTLVAILLCSFMLASMLQQLSAQELYVSGSDNSYLLNNSSLHSYQYLLNRLNFNTSKQDFSGMVTTPGFIILLLPLSYFLLIDKSKIINSKLLKQMMIIGYLLMMIQSSAFMLGSLYIFNFMQFTWRFTNIATVLLIIPGVIYFSHLVKCQYLSILIAIFWLVNGYILNLQVLDRTMSIPNDFDYNELIGGSIIDPFYGDSFYYRVELAAADYLPTNSISFKEYPYGIHLQNDIKVIATPSINYDELNFNIDTTNQTIVLPRTYYLGYTIYHNDTKLETFNDPYTGLVAFKQGDTTGEYTLVYEKTLIHKLGIITSLITVIYLIIKKLFHK